MQNRLAHALLDQVQPVYALIDRLLDVLPRYELSVIDAPPVVCFDDDIAKAAESRRELLTIVDEPAAVVDDTRYRVGIEVVKLFSLS